MFINAMLNIIREAVCARYCRMIKISLNLLLSLVNDMVDLKLVKENRLEPQFVDFNPTKVLKFVTDLLQVQAEG